MSRDRDLLAAWIEKSPAKTSNMIEDELSSFFDEIDAHVISRGVPDARVDEMLDRIDDSIEQALCDAIMKGCE